MNICEATRKAVEENKYISREAHSGCVVIKIKPTNTPDCCIISDGKQIPRRGWQPQAEDLTADDWVVMD